MDKKGGFSKLPKVVQKGLKKALEQEHPFLLSPISWALSKAIGPKKVNDLYWKYLQRPVANADISLGRSAQKVLDKVTGKKGKTFVERRVLETGKKNREFTGRKEHEIPSFLAPLSKASKFVIPVAGGLKLEEMYSKHKGKGDMSDKTISKAELHKTAEMLTFLVDGKCKLEKEAKATELLYKQAEMGQIRFPKTFAEYQEKVAELLSRDLKVVEEAIKLASTSEEVNSLGGLDTQKANTAGAHETFVSTIIND